MLYHAVKGGNTEIVAFLVDEMGLNVEKEYPGVGLTGAPNSEKKLSNRDWFPTVISHEPKPRRVW